jgi:hypothetical protein
MIQLNVGGTSFATSSKTLKSCGRFRAILDDLQGLQGQQDDKPIFLDRDPVVFSRTLKTLRGYPCGRELINDSDLISELVWLEHDFLDGELPEWLDDAIHPADSKNTNHTLDPVQSARYSQTRVLVASDALEKLERVLPANQYPKCVVVGVGEGWVNSQWVPVHDIDTAKMKLRFMKYFLPYIDDAF